MLSQEFVSSLLQASITGAGLVLAVYALIIPLSRRLFSYRAEEIYENIQELKKRILDTGAHVSTEEISELETLLETIGKRKEFPTYLSWGAGITFFGYIASTFLSFFWMIDYNRPTADNWLPSTFFISTFFFLLLGIISIKDISQTMKREFEELKKKVEETKSKADIAIEL